MNKLEKMERRFETLKIVLRLLASAAENLKWSEIPEDSRQKVDELCATVCGSLPLLDENFR